MTLMTGCSLVIKIQSYTRGVISLVELEKYVVTHMDCDQEEVFIDDYNLLRETDSYLVDYAQHLMTAPQLKTALCALIRGK